jgi:hypothetical protein
MENLTAQNSSGNPSIGVVEEGIQGLVELH